MRATLIAAVLALGSIEATACEKYLVRVLSFDVHENILLSVAELNSRFREPGKPIMVSFIQAKATVKSDPKRCALTVGYEDPTLYVSAEANADECMKKRVFSRERERLKVYERYVATLDKRVIATSKRFKDDLVGGPKPELLSALFDELAAFESDLAATDSELSYSALPFACDGVMSRFIAK
jgi:hypothetical protein